MTRPQLAAVFAALVLIGSRTGPLAASELLSLDVRDLDIYDAVRLLSTQGSTNVVVDSSVAHRPITLRLHDVSFDEALATLAQANDLEAVRVGKIVYLGTSDEMNRRYASDAARGVRLTTFRIASADPDELAKTLGDALPRGTIVLPDRRTSSVIVSGTPASLHRARELIDSLDRASGMHDSLLPMRFVKASEALKALQATLPVVAPDSAYASDQQNALVLYGAREFIAQATSIVRRIDRPGQQVRYEVRVTDLTPTESSNIGFLFGGVDVNGQQQAGSGSTVTTFLRNSLAINATINALVSKGEAQILARPSLSSLNNVQASLLVGEQYPIVYFDARTGTQQVQFVNVGVNLSVTPTIGSDGAITTDLETDYSQVTGTISSFPIITTRKAQSTLRVGDGETIVIAGLFSDVDRSTLTKVPFLGDIPFLGEVFRNRARDRSKDEVVFLITPHLVRDGDPKNAVPSAGLPALR
jgi:type II secretory pathway component GspD/PulD (secretin)